MLPISTAEIETLLQPENELEKKIILDSDWQEGVAWGKPRWGHPEGAVLYHIKEVLENVDKITENEMTRERLRLISLIHDTFKHKEHKGTPRDWNRHHAKLARAFAERYIDDREVLDVIELHDEAYYAWRYLQFDLAEKAKKRLDHLLSRINGSRQLYYLFFKCDTQTGDKTQLPVAWFEETIEGIKPVSF